MGVRKGFLLAALCAANLDGQVAAPAATPHANINGTVVDSAGRPLIGVEISLVVQDSTLSSTRTGDDGQFLVGGIISGRSWLHVRRLGFQSRDVELFFPRDSTRMLLIQLDATPQDLAAAEVHDTAGTHLWLREFNERRQSNGLGHYFTRADIVRRQPLYLSEMLRVVPRVTMARSRTGGLVLRMRGCRYAPMVWLDGSRVVGSELDEIARVDDVEAMEVYPTSAGVPAQYLDRTNVGCGTILVWSRR
jgi:hypothetical protein